MSLILSFNHFKKICFQKEVLKTVIAVALGISSLKTGSKSELENALISIRAGYS